jgi:hypothetical protein
MGYLSNLVEPLLFDPHLDLGQPEDQQIYGSTRKTYSSRYDKIFRLFAF